MNNTNVTKTSKQRGRTQVIRKGKQFLNHIWHPSRYSRNFDESDTKHRHNITITQHSDHFAILGNGNLQYFYLLST